MVGEDRNNSVSPYNKEFSSNIKVLRLQRLGNLRIVCSAMRVTPGSVVVVVIVIIRGIITIIVVVIIIIIAKVVTIGRRQLQLSYISD